VSNAPEQPAVTIKKPPASPWNESYLCSNAAPTPVRRPLPAGYAADNVPWTALQPLKPISQTIVHSAPLSVAPIDYSDDQRNRVFNSWWRGDSEAVQATKSHHRATVYPDVQLDGSAPPKRDQKTAIVRDVEDVHLEKRCEKCGIRYADRK
jgi:hypothetical protein